MYKITSTILLDELIHWNFSRGISPNVYKSDQLS